MCEWKPDFDRLNEILDQHEVRLLKVETSVGEMRKECSAGFTGINVAVANLAHEFGSRMNTLDQKMLEEKQRWGAVIRKIVMMAAYTIISGAAVAMGVTIYKEFCK